ncbi:hypothetical protein BJ322DRAFT_1104864 [Thelephora terrestris]|uniref:F-box domain-containing protein n=1 Tax=Thelephora terrestris TaxID=56493 RepID=A0A9P6HP79_9AGAM|nr:hypothetical protein BJ322DRAFT_1104864 [Thelephora terrestris]
MSTTLPPEILDLIVDHLHDEPDTLEACCLVSKSWVPRARRHLFADVEFSSPTSVQSWMRAFLHPSNSPAHQTRSLSIYGFLAIASAESTVVRAWVHSFRHIETLVVNLSWNDGDSLSQLHGLSPILKSLKVDESVISPPELIDLICSFPLLEDVWLRCIATVTWGDTDGWDIPSTSPKLTGSLYLSGDIHPVVRRMLDLPGGLHFAKISTFCPVEAAGATIDLVSSCSGTLESLCVGYTFFRPDRFPPPLDLSEATKLKDIEFWFTRPEIRWNTTALLSAKSEYLQQITIHSLAIFADPVGEGVSQEWQDLDHLLVRLWTERSILPKFQYTKGRVKGGRGEIVPFLLPELTRMGAVEDKIIRTLSMPWSTL